MQLKHFTIGGLFNRLSHDIDFPVANEEGTDPSVVIVYGRNGIGKTTILRMLDGLLRLDFNIFRQIPLSYCSLEFDTSQRLEIRCDRKPKLSHLEVSFDGITVFLHPERAGTLVEEDLAKVELFRQRFFKQTETITYEFIDTERLELQRLDDESEEGWASITASERMVRGRIDRVPARNAQPNPKARFLEQPQSLATRVRRFIRDAQVNYRLFFATNEPELFPRIVERLLSAQQPNYDIKNLTDRFEKIHIRDKMNLRFGLEPDRWDYEEMMNLLNTLSHRTQEGGDQALTVLGAYVEQLESRCAQRVLVGDRLRTFERLIGDFFAGKTVSIGQSRGFHVKSESGYRLDESQLSSGEFHLLLLMVAALVTKRRGTVIAIDEPEMSMHIAWQRKLVPALVECASKANPLFIFATHSPDVASSFPQAMVELK